MINFTNRLLDYKDFRKYSDTLIETGSGHGDGIQRALDSGFEKVISIEAYDESFGICARRFSGNKKVRLCRGLSVEWLPRLLAEGWGRLVIFLDAHPSGELSFGHTQLMSGDVNHSQDHILKEELRIILKGLQRHAIIVDDVNGEVGGCAQDYARMVSHTFPDYRFMFFDENLGKFYKDKILVCVPGELP